MTGMYGPWIEPDCKMTMLSIRPLWSVKCVVKIQQRLKNESASLPVMTQREEQFSFTCLLYIS